MKTSRATTFRTFASALALATAVFVFAAAATVATIAATSTPALADTKKEALTIGVTAGPHEEILEVVKDILAGKGISIKIVTFTDYVTPNIALAQGDIDANSFQHGPYLERFAKDRRLNLVAIAKTFVFPIGVYSKKIKSIEQLRPRAVIAIPNDPTNGGRALLLLQKAGFIKLRSGVGITPSVFDITENPKKLDIKELDAAQLPRSLEDVDAAVVNTNYAIEAGLDPVKDAIFREGADSPYANIIAVRAEDKDKPIFKELVQAYHSQRVADFVKEKYKGAVVPAF